MRYVINARRYFHKLAAFTTTLHGERYFLFFSLLHMKYRGMESLDVLRTEIQMCDIVRYIFLLTGSAAKVMTSQLYSKRLNANERYRRLI